MKIIHIYPVTCEYAYPKYLSPNLHPDAFDREIMCNTDLEVRYLKGLQELGVDCTLLYPRRFNLPVKSFVHRGGYRIIRFPVTFFEGQTGKALPLGMLRYIKKEKPDLVHFHGIYGGKQFFRPPFFDIMAFFCKINKIPFFGWYHVGTFPQGRRMPFLWIPARFIKSCAFRSCWGITSINQNELGRLFDSGDPEYYGIHFSKLPHLHTPNTFDNTIFYPVSRDESLARTGLDKDKRYILMVARLFPEKGLHNLLNVMPELACRFPDVHLLIIGEFIHGTEEYKQKIKHIIEDLNIHDRVAFLGRIEHQGGLLYYYNLADVFVLPTLKETFGGVNLEAIACGTPVISTDCGEIPYYLTKGVGIIVPKGNETALLNAVTRMLSGDFKIYEEERDRIMKKYDYRSAALLLKKWYENVIGNRRRN